MRYGQGDTQSNSQMNNKKPTPTVHSIFYRNNPEVAKLMVDAMKTFQRQYSDQEVDIIFTNLEIIGALKFLTSSDEYQDGFMEHFKRHLVNMKDEKIKHDT